jgi:hypothetical protein
MGLRQREWAARTTKKLKTILGGCCAECKTKRKLQFDCIRPTGDWHHRIEWSWRISFYRKQLREQNLQLLCEFHNKQKSNRVPF